MAGEEVMERGEGRVWWGEGVVESEGGGVRSDERGREG